MPKKVKESDDMECPYVVANSGWHVYSGGLVANLFSVVLKFDMGMVIEYLPTSLRTCG